MVVAAVLTYLIGGNATAAVATVLVACSCAIAMATPVTVLAAVGSSAPSREGPAGRASEPGRQQGGRYPRHVGDGRVEPAGVGGQVLAPRSATRTSAMALFLGALGRYRRQVGLYASVVARATGSNVTAVLMKL